MRITLHRVMGMAGLLLTMGLTPSAHGQLPTRPLPGPPPLSNFNRLPPPPVFVPVPIVTNIQVQTGARIPNGGNVLLGSYSQMATGRNQFGVPMLSQMPYANRLFSNVGHGQQAVIGQVGASVRIINLREEEFRQTGVRVP